MPNIIVKKYEHYNRALGKHITSKKQYENEMQRQGMVSADKGNEMAAKTRESRRKEYKPDKDTLQFVNSLHGDKNGKIQLSGRQLEFMKKKGVSLERPKDRPLEGGWE